MKRVAKVLVVEDQQSERNALARLLRLEGYEVEVARDPIAALEFLNVGVELVVSDMKMGERTGIDLLREWKRFCPATPFIMLTAYGDVESAVCAMKLGAADYLAKPIHPEELLLLVRRTLETSQAADTIRNLEARLDMHAGFGKIIGRSAIMREVLDRTQRAAASDSLVLLLGESGSGKELIAEAIHQHSRRKNGPFVAVNMAAIPPDLVESELFGHTKGAFTGAILQRLGRFEAANGGTLFIDEVGDFAQSSQAKLLRVLETYTLSPVGSNEERPIDVRVVAATSRDLRGKVANGEFRDDLYYRLNVVTIEIPALRQRREDIPLLIDHFLDEICSRNQRTRPALHPSLMEFLESCDWPGNVRQLRNSLESMVVLAMGDTLTMADVPSSLRDLPEPEPALAALAGVGAGAGTSHMGRGFATPGDMTLEDLERQAVLKTLERCQWNRTHAAEQLGISVRTLQRRLKAWGWNHT